ncbi:acylase [Variovorax sp. KBW07]|uniref:penicillin acylase family protein n=1 Tax=Variovorax sp. KBW07 TaxID=2153358 RepID=UPI000F57D28A|nr:penicillin acylase family protein [Variovorax sp. KBW07]RQO53273.1 acylase [Variovorax sp. KBW07]
MTQTTCRGRTPFFLLALVAAATLTACGGGGGDGFAFMPFAGNPGNPVNPPVEGNYKAEIRRTAMGVPHIKADTWGGAGYGYGYAQAQDNLCTMADSFLTYRGERSQYLGGDTPLAYPGTISQPKNIESDFFHRHVLSDDVLKKMTDAQSDDMKKLAEGFAAGYNRYVRDVKANGSAHAACRSEAWVQPITADDIFRRMHAANLVAGYGNFLLQIAGATAPTPAPVAKVAARSNSKKKQQQALQLAALDIRVPELHVGGKGGVGSNMLGFGTEGTGDASPLLFGNPHWYWRGPDRFYQAQLTIPGKLNVSGASFLGVPVIQIGFNDNIAWTHTVSTARRFGLYELKLAAGNPTSYMRDGSAVKMQAHEITVKLKQADGSMGTATRTLYKSEYGPLINQWDQTTAFAIRDINADNYRTFRNWLRWNQAKSLDEFTAIQRQEAAIPWVNTVAVGRGSAKAWYADIGAVPNVSADQIANCTSTSPIGMALQASLAPAPVFDGSRSACDWQTDADSAQKGALGAARMPSLMRDDYVANMNNSYWLTNLKEPLTGFPPIYGSLDAGFTTRARLGLLMAQARIDGTDGYTGKKATADTVRQMVLNSRSYTAERFKTRALDLVCAVPTINVAAHHDLFMGDTPAGTVDSTAACAALRTWDNAGNTESRGALVWDEFWTRVENLPPDDLYAVPFSAADPLNTPRDLKSSATNALRQVFGAALMRINASPYAVDAPRGDYLFVTRNGKKIPLFGGCADFTGYFTTTCSLNPLDKGGYTMDSDTVVANSYMQVVRFPADGVEAHTFLTYSLSDDPASAHHADYTRAYSAKQWLRLPFSEAEIKADAGYSSAVVSE